VRDEQGPPPAGERRVGGGRWRSSVTRAPAIVGSRAVGPLQSDARGEGAVTVSRALPAFPTFQGVRRRRRDGRSRRRTSLSRPGCGSGRPAMEVDSGPRAEPKTRDCRSGRAIQARPARSVRPADGAGAEVEVAVRSDRRFDHPGLGGAFHVGRRVADPPHRDRDRPPRGFTGPRRQAAVGGGRPACARRAREHVARAVVSFLAPTLRPGPTGRVVEVVEQERRLPVR